MNILAIDTSSKAASCALLRDGVLAGEFFSNTGLTHSGTSMPMVRALLEQCRTTLGEIDLFGVTTGPGSFTGLRIGISSVKGMAFALNRPCAPVSTLEALAAGVLGVEGWVAPCMDARRAQVYTALFRCGGGALSRQGEDEALSVDALGERLAALAPEPVLLVGDGAELAHKALEKVSHIHLAPERVRHQRAASVAVIARRMAGAGELVTAEALAPSYLRLPQAERERLERQAAEHTGHPEDNQRGVDKA